MNIELEKVVETYERNQKKGGNISCFGVLKLLSDFFDEENNPQSIENISLRDRLYVVLSGPLFIGQQYSFPDRKPREDLYIILQQESNITTDRIEKMRKALRNLPTAERNFEVAKETLKKTIEKLEKKAVAQQEGVK